MSLLKDATMIGIGYVASELSGSHPLREAIDDKLNRNKANKNLRDIIAEYARSRGIYTTSNELAHELEKIADTYKGYDYPY